MADVYNMKKVFSCSDFLSDIWQGGSDGNETLGGLQYSTIDEGGSTQLGQEGSTDLFRLLNQAEEADSDCRKLANLTASSSNKQETGTGETLAHLGIAVRQPTEILSSGRVNCTTSCAYFV